MVHCICKGLLTWFSVYKAKSHGSLGASCISVKLSDMVYCLLVLCILSLVTSSISLMLTHMI